MNQRQHMKARCGGNAHPAYPLEISRWGASSCRWHDPSTCKRHNEGHGNRSERNIKHLRGASGWDSESLLGSDLPKQIGLCVCVCVYNRICKSVSMPEQQRGQRDVLRQAWEEVLELEGGGGTDLLVTRWRSFISALSNQTWGHDLTMALWRTPIRPPCTCPTWRSHFLTVHKYPIERRTNEEMLRKVSSWTIA